MNVLCMQSFYNVNGITASNLLDDLGWSIKTDSISGGYSLKAQWHDTLIHKWIQEPLIKKRSPRQGSAGDSTSSYVIRQ